MTDHDKRVYHHMYETGEGIAEHAERIAKLEEMCRELMGWVCCLQLGGKLSRNEYIKLENRMCELGMAVE